MKTLVLVISFLFLYGCKTEVSVTTNNKVNTKIPLVEYSDQIPSGVSKKDIIELQHEPHLIKQFKVAESIRLQLSLPARRTLPYLIVTANSTPLCENSSRCYIRRLGDDSIGNKIYHRGSVFNTLLLAELHLSKNLCGYKKMDDIPSVKDYSKMVQSISAGKLLCHRLMKYKEKGVKNADLNTGYQLLRTLNL